MVDVDGNVGVLVKVDVMRDQHRGTVAQQSADRVLKEVLCNVGVDRRQGVVEEHKGSPRINRTRQPDPGLLA